jgi:hypothetical protein
MNNTPAASDCETAKSDRHDRRTQTAIDAHHNRTMSGRFGASAVCYR